MFLCEIGYSPDMYGGAAAGFGAALAALIIINLLLFLVGIVFYIMGAYGLYKMAQNRNIDNAWFAFIPFLNLYLIGKFVPTVKISTYEVPRLDVVLPVGLLVSIVLSGIPFIGWLLYLAYFILLSIALYNLYKEYTPGSALILAIFTFTGIVPAIYFFTQRDAKPKVSYASPFASPKEDVVEETPAPVQEEVADETPAAEPVEEPAVEAEESKEE